jgi:hypothetical protein
LIFFIVCILSLLAFLYLDKKVKRPPIAEAVCGIKTRPKGREKFVSSLEKFQDAQASLAARDQMSKAKAGGRTSLVEVLPLRDSAGLSNYDEVDHRLPHLNAAHPGVSVP